MRFIKSLKGEKIKGEPIVFSSNKKSPLSIFSSIPFNKQQQFVFNFRDSLKEHGKRRHTSSSNRQLSTILDGPEPLNFFDVMGLDRPVDGRGISFQHLLNGSSNSGSLLTNNNTTTFLNQNQYGITRTTSHLTNKKKPLLTQHSVIDYSSAECVALNCQTKPQFQQTNVLNNILNNSISNQHASFHHSSLHSHHQPNNTHTVASRCQSLEQQTQNQQRDCFVDLTSTGEQLNNNELLKAKMQITYNANLLDDPELIAGKHSTLLVFPSFVVSLLCFLFD